MNYILNNLFRGLSLIHVLFQRIKLNKKNDESSTVASTPAAEMRERIIKRVALEFKNGMYGILFKRIENNDQIS